MVIGVPLVAKTAAVIYANMRSYDQIGTVLSGETVIASGQCVQQIGGNRMVPIKPNGAVFMDKFSVAAKRQADHPETPPSKRMKMDDGALFFTSYCEGRD